MNNVRLYLTKKLTFPKPYMNVSIIYTEKVQRMNGAFKLAIHLWKLKKTQIKTKLMRNVKFD